MSNQLILNSDVNIQKYLESGEWVAFYQNANAYNHIFRHKNRLYSMGSPCFYAVENLESLNMGFLICKYTHLSDIFLNTGALFELPVMEFECLPEHTLYLFYNELY